MVVLGVQYAAAAVDMAHAVQARDVVACDFAMQTLAQAPEDDLVLATVMTLGIVYVQLRDLLGVAVPHSTSLERLAAEVSADVRPVIPRATPVHVEEMLLAAALLPSDLRGIAGDTALALLLALVAELARRSGHSIDELFSAAARIFQLRETAHIPPDALLREFGVSLH